MTLILLVFAALIVALQIALTFTLKRMLDLIAATRDQVDSLQRRVQALEQGHDTAESQPSALFALAPRTDTAPEPQSAAASEEGAEPAEIPVLHEEVSAPTADADAVGVQVRALARQGLPVREIAERFGLSEAEAELIINLRQEPI
ncbi:MAG: DUF2802 domain-containing protein [Thiomonas sp.]